MSGSNLGWYSVRFDFSAPYQKDNEWFVDEFLYPESKGCIRHSFATEQEANAFAVGRVK